MLFRSSSFLITSGSFKAFTVAALSLSIMAVGVPAVVNRPNQLTSTKSFNSGMLLMGGTSGNTLMGLSDETPMGLTLLAWMKGSRAAQLANVALTWPPATSADDWQRMGEGKRESINGG